MLNIFKKGHVTLTSDVEVWVVRWNQRHGKFSDDYKEVAQFFIDKEEAKAFAESLRRATKLLGHTAGHLKWVEYEKVDRQGL
ncbi:MAG: hypothetical protein ABS939_13720 [Psychrobacillus sp.]